LGGSNAVGVEADDGSAVVRAGVGCLVVEADVSAVAQPHNAAADSIAITET